MRRLLAVAAVAALVLLSAAASAPALVNTGELRILVVLATWGPQPFTRDQVQQTVFKETDAFVRENSFGAAWLAGEVTPWVNAFPSPPRCSTPAEQDDLAAAAKTAAKSAGFDVASYSRFIYLFPGLSSCGYGGYGSLREVFLNGALNQTLVAHELGHTFGLQHAHTIDCAHSSCAFIEYGDVYDTMGSGQGDYNAYEKNVAGWLANVTRVTRNGTYAIDELERKSTTPQALVVQTARNEYWLDHREPLLGDAIFAGTEIVDGVEIHAGPPSSDPIATGDYSTANTLVPNPGGRGSPVLSPGESFGEQGAFRLVVLDHVGTHVDVQFQWTDTTRPTTPTLDSPGKSVRGTVVTVEWEPTMDTGSGVDRYIVSLDGRRRATIAADFTVPPLAHIAKLTRGAHTVSVVALDRAGNRSRPATRKFSAR